MTPEQLQEKKNAFLARYNGRRSNAIAVSSGLKAASQRNPLYVAGLPQSARECIREEWRALLRATAAKYESPIGAPEYEQDIQELKRAMNERFLDCFRSQGHTRSGYDPGFRISHAQKSLSVFLKHLWCMNTIATPPQCPVDRIVLWAAGLSDRETRWTHVNTIEEHRCMIAH